MKSPAKLSLIVVITLLLKRREAHVKIQKSDSEKQLRSEIQLGETDPEGKRTENHLSLGGN